MFGHKNENPLQDAIDSMLRELVQVEGNSEQAERIVARLTELNELQKTNSSGPVSKDVVVTAATNLAGILLILHHERANVIATKALAFVQKLR
jgi:hypothetical protein